MNKNIFYKKRNSKIEVTTKIRVMGAENYDPLSFTSGSEDNI
jgi:hypothetical protein